jgi:chromosome segregation ATPase
LAVDPVSLSILATIGELAAVLAIVGGIAKACYTLGSVEQVQQQLLSAMSQLPELAADIATLTAEHRRTRKAIPKIRRRLRSLERRQMLLEEIPPRSRKARRSR